ncbi:MAG: GntR family transcriptional regulator [Caldilineaceae bacterium]|nr:GntR family transcriptional regulator [Caldilineaceae bacterium]
METSTLAERVYETLKGRILQHEYSHGQKLNIAALAEDLNVSNTPVREAISRLEKVGLVKVVPYRGPFVRSLSPSEAAGVFEVRIALESLAARLAAASADDDARAEIQRLRDAQQAAFVEHNMELALDLDVHFHEAIAQSTGNSALVGLLQMLADWTVLFMQFGLPTPRPPERVIDEHDQIVAAIAARDGDRADEAMRIHIAAARDNMIAHLAEQTET